MPIINIIDSLGNTRQLKTGLESNLMQVAVNNNVKGVEGECGGCCSCATCHVSLSVQEFNKLSPMDDDEQGLLEFVSNSLPTSRLACQIKVSDDLENMTFKVQC
ncbi:MAG: 2Fe-2S ferredoxin [Shewanella sp.]|jgi:2Fe-2S ferredoxin